MGRFKDIFEWDEMFEIEVFYDCELIRDIGGFRRGEEFDNIQFDKHDLVLYFYKNEGLMNKATEYLESRITP